VYDVTNVQDTNTFIVNNLSVHNCEEAFLNSVFPVVSSSKESQIIIVSTPNGMNNEYYRIWNKAKLNINTSKDDVKWTPVEIDWSDVPGRDEKWKKIQMESFNGDESRFLQEYGNCLGPNTKISVYDLEEKQYKEISIKELFKNI